MSPGELAVDRGGERERVRPAIPVLTQMEARRTEREGAVVMVHAIAAVVDPQAPGLGLLQQQTGEFRFEIVTRGIRGENAAAVGIPVDAPVRDEMSQVHGQP